MLVTIIQLILIINYERSLHTIFGNITIKMPRVRLGQFQNKLLTPYNQNFGNLEEMIIQLYQQCIATRKTDDFFENVWLLLFATNYF